MKVYDDHDDNRKKLDSESLLAPSAQDKQKYPISPGRLLHLLGSMYWFFGHHEILNALSEKNLFRIVIDDF